jgi:AcrR family transcriptional regulator
VAAAARLFAEDGFVGVTVDQIGGACGISGPALYHHFASKEALLGEVLLSISEHLLASGTELVAQAEDPAAALAALVDGHVSFSVTRPELITVYFRDLVHATAEDQRTIRRLQRRYVEVWVAAIERAVPGVDSRVARAAVHALLGLLNSTPFAPALSQAEHTTLLCTLAWRLVDPASLPDLLGGP